MTWVNSLGHVLFPFARWQHDHAQTPLPCETSMTRCHSPSPVGRADCMCLHGRPCAWLPFAAVCCYTLFYLLICQDLQSRRRDLRLALLYKVVMGHVGIQPENVVLVAADDRTRAKHRYKFCAVGSSTQAFRHSFAVQTVGDWNPPTLPPWLRHCGWVIALCKNSSLCMNTFHCNELFFGDMRMTVLFSPIFIAREHTDVQY